MNNTLETTATNANAAATSSKQSDTAVDGAVFANELGQYLSQSDSSENTTQATLDRLMSSLPGMTASRGIAPSVSQSLTYYLEANNQTQAAVTISDEMLEQMSQDEEMFNKVKEMVSSLVTTGQNQNLAPSTGNKTNLWQSLSIDVNNTRLVQVSRDQNNNATSLSSLTLSTQEIIQSSLDTLLNMRNTNGSSSQTSSFNRLVSNSTSWDFEIAYSSTSQAMESLRSSQSIIAQLDLTIEQFEYGASSFDLMSFIRSSGLCDPLVFDLGDEGINLTSAENGVYFDIKGDGSPVQTAWITGNNAFLYLDENGNGIVDDGNELFGDQGGHANGFEKLAQYDSNNDGVIDDKDEIYSQLRLWRDLNGDGINQASESLTLAEAGIASVNLNHDNSRTFDAYGNMITDQSSFTRTDGTQGLVADAWFKTQSRRR